MNTGRAKRNLIPTLRALQSARASSAVFALSAELRLARPKHPRTYNRLNSDDADAGKADQRGSKRIRLAKLVLNAFQVFAGEQF